LGRGLYSCDVTVHQIKLTLPTIEIGPRDLVFEVIIDGTAQGTLHASKGGLDWWPNTSDGAKTTKTWSQLQAFMEGDAKRVVRKEYSWPIPDEEVFDSRDSLLGYFGFSDFGSMTDLVDEMLEDDFGILLSVDEYGTHGFEINAGKYQRMMEYPFTMGEFQSAMKDIDKMAMADTAYEELAAQIEKIEGFPVEVRFDWFDLPGWADIPNVEWLDSGFGAVQFPSDYPYKRAMNKNKTIEDWTNTRFEPNYPWLVVTVSTKLPDTALLADVRNE
jgi:hypothetical protein